jgi:outer membrane autotransporter protein
LARAIDVTAATGTGHNIRMLDGRLEAFTRATPLATATNVGTAVAMQGNGQADALDWSGGAILADIVGDQGVDNLDVFAGVDDVLNFSAAIKGLATIDVNTAAQAATPIEFRVNGEVSDVQVLAVNQNGTLVVGPAAAISVAFYAQDAGGKVFFEINAPSNGPPANGGIFLALGASPDGTIGIRPLPGLYAETQSYLVIDGPLFSTFSGSVSNSPLLTLTVEQDSPDVVLHVARVPFDEVPGLQSENHGALVQVLEDLYDPDELGGTDLGEVVGALFGLNAEELSDAFDDLHGAEHAQMVYGGFEAAQFLSSGIGERLNDARGQAPGDGQGTEAPSLQYAEAGAADAQLAALGAYDPDRPASVWARGIGSFGTLDGDAEAPGYDRTTGAVVLGIDYRIDEAFLIGLAGAYAYSSFDFDDGDQGDINSFQIGLFGSWDSGTFYVDGLVSYAFQSYDTERTVDFGMVEGTAKGDYDGSAVQVYGEVGYQFQAGEQFLLQPLVGLGWTSVWTDSFTETGAAGANLTVDEARYDSLQTTLGARASLQLEGWVPSLFLGWRHEFLDDRAEADVAFAAAPDNQFTVIGSDIGSDSGLVGVGVLAELSEQFEAVVDYSGQFSGAGTSHTGSLGVRLKF